MINNILCNYSLVIMGTYPEIKASQSLHDTLFSHARACKTEKKAINK